MKTAIIKNTGIDKDILLEIVSRDKAIAAQIIEEFEDMCEYYEKALNAAEDLPEKKEIQKLIEESCKN